MIGAVSRQPVRIPSGLKGSLILLTFLRLLRVRVVFPPPRVFRMFRFLHLLRLRRRWGRRARSVGESAASDRRASVEEAGGFYRKRVEARFEDVIGLWIRLRSARLSWPPPVGSSAQTSNLPRSLK